MVELSQLAYIFRRTDNEMLKNLVWSYFVFYINIGIHRSGNCVFSFVVDLFSRFLLISRPHRDPGLLYTLVFLLSSPYKFTYGDVLLFQMFSNDYSYFPFH